MKYYISKSKIERIQLSANFDSVELSDFIECYGLHQVNWFRYIIYKWFKI